MWLLYQIVIILALVLAGPWLLLRRGRHYLESLPGRLGSYDGIVPESPLWVHAVSVGEVGVAATLVDALPDDLPLVVTTITPTGQERAFSTLDGRVAVAFFPFDLGFAIRRFLERFSPRGLVLIEGDLWPLVLRLVKKRGLPVVVVNGRISDRNFRRLRLLRHFLEPLLGRVDRFGVQTSTDHERLSALGVPAEKLEVTGNLKFESLPPPELPELEASVLALAKERPVLVAGSTMRGEEVQVLEAFEHLGGGETAMLILAPRHPERVDEVANLLAEGRVSAIRRSRLDPDSRPDVLLLDTLGELASLYRIGTAAFIGGTLVPTGGHNPLEPARFRVPIAVGPSMDNFREMARQFDQADAWRRVATGAELGSVWKQWLINPEPARRLGERAAELVASNQGALDRTVKLLRAVIESHAIGAPVKSHDRGAG